MIDNYDNAVIATYVENGGGYCPECERESVKQERPRGPEDGRITIDCCCTSCQAQWQDQYILDDCISEAPGNQASQTQLFSIAGSR